MSIVSKFIQNFQQTELSGQLFLQHNFSFLAGHPGLYIIRNPIDPNKNRFKLGMGTNMINRLNTYFTYFPTGLEVFFCCALKYQDKTTMYRHETDLWRFVIDASGGTQNVGMQFSPGRTSGTEWIVVNRDALWLGVAAWVKDAIDQNIYISSNIDDKMNEILRQGTAEKVEVHAAETAVYSREKYKNQLKLLKAYANIHDLEELEDEPLIKPIARIPSFVVDRAAAQLKKTAKKKKKPAKRVRAAVYKRYIKPKERAPRKKQKDPDYEPEYEAKARPHRKSEMKEYRKAGRRSARQRGMRQNYREDSD